MSTTGARILTGPNLTPPRRLFVKGTGMSGTDLVVELLNLDAEIRHARKCLASPKRMRPWWHQGDVQQELAWLVHRRELVMHALACGPRIVREPTWQTRRYENCHDAFLGWADREACAPSHGNAVPRDYNFSRTPEIAPARR